jgi:hypothetical protein
MNYQPSQTPRSASWLALVLLLSGAPALAQSTQDRVHRMALPVFNTATIRTPPSYMVQPCRA